jgi:CBS domain-containing protein
MHTELVRDWMTPDPICARPDMSLPDALQLMKQRSIRRLPIVDKGRLVGIVTRGDLRGAQPSEATSLSIFELHYLVGRITLDQIMTPDPLTVVETATIQEAARLMLQHKVAGLPVLDANHRRLVGIITESDIFRLVVRNWESAPLEPGAPGPQDPPVAAGGGEPAIAAV